MDFNLLSTYGSCSGNDYRLFTIDRAGRASSLGAEEFYAAPPHTKSTSCIVGEGGLLGVCYYSQGVGAYVTGWCDRTVSGWTLVLESGLSDLDGPWCPYRPAGA